VSADQHRFVSADRRVREDRRFVAGKGRFVADIDLPDTKQVALLTCPHAAARIISIDKRASAPPSLCPVFIMCWTEVNSPLPHFR